MDRKMVDFIKEQYPPGTRIRLNSMEDPYYRLPYQEAVLLLLGRKNGKSYEQAKPVKEAPKPFALPEPYGTMRRMYAYLMRQRHIDREVISAFVHEKLLYEDRHHNCVFVGLDDRGEAKHAHIRSTNSEGRVFRMNIEGSASEHCFHKNGTDKSLYVFEAPIDLLSHITLYEDNRTEQVEIVSLPCPIFEDGEKLVMQRGVGVCTVKSTPEREKACMTFLKWLTEPERNVDFVTSLGYMPVTKEGFDRYLPAAIETLSDPMYVSLYEVFLKTRQDYTFYVPPQREDYLNLETHFEKAVRLRLAAGRAQYLEQGADALEPLLRTVREELQKSYGK